MEIRLTAGKEGGLVWRAASFSSSELEAVEYCFKEMGIVWDSYDGGVDDSRREIKIFEISATDARAIQEGLNVQFALRSDGSIAVAPTPTQTGSQYKCEELALSGIGKGCEGFNANTYAQAMVKCAMIANRRGWFGGSASLGQCSVI